MSEYACEECPEHCRVMANKKPIYCLYSGFDTARWFKIEDKPEQRPEEGKEETLWCKKDAFCWNPQKGYGVVTWKGQRGTGVYTRFFKDKDETGLLLKDLLEAKYEPWTRQEWESCIGQKFRTREGLFMLLGVADHEDGFYLDFSDCSGTPQCLEKEENSLRQMDGTPCGNLSHKSEDGKDWVI